MSVPCSSHAVLSNLAFFVALAATPAHASSVPEPAAAAAVAAAPRLRDMAADLNCAHGVLKRGVMRSAQPCVSAQAVGVAYVVFVAFGLLAWSSLRSTPAPTRDAAKRPHHFRDVLPKPFATSVCPPRAFDGPSAARFAVRHGRRRLRLPTERCG